MKYRCIITGLLAILLLALTSCTNQNPVSPTATSQTLVGQGTVGDSVFLQARIRTSDQNRRMLTLAGSSDTVVAAHNCEIVRFKNDNESPVPFTDIGPTDSVWVHGQRQQNGYVMAYQLRVCADSCWDLALRDTIISIDHQAGTFTVAGRGETIVVDDATLIWSREVRKQWTTHEPEMRGPHFTAAGTGPGYHLWGWDTALEFTDLSVGDLVAVKASIVDETTLLAVAIKRLACSDFEQRCIEFEATLATVDVATRVVTFVDLDWNGLVCKGAQLKDANGLPLTLADFAPGELVAVKGLPGEDEELRICRMEKL